MSHTGQDGTGADDDTGFTEPARDGTEFDPAPDTEAFGLQQQNEQPRSGYPRVPSPPQPPTGGPMADLPWGQPPPSGASSGPYAGPPGPPPATAPRPQSTPPSWSSPPPQPPWQGGPAAPPQPPWQGGPAAPPTGGGRGQIWIIAGVVAMLLVVAVVGGVVFVNRSTTPVTTLPTRAVSPSADQPSHTPSDSSSSPTPTDNPSNSAGTPTSGVTAIPPPATPVVAGWKAVEGREFVAYDVPPDWKIGAPSLLTGFETSGGPHQTVIMHNPATYKQGACGGKASTYRAQTGFVSPKGEPAGAAAKSISRRWATVAGVKADGSPSPLGATQVSTVKIAGGTITADVATTVLTVTEPGNCAAPTMSFTAVSFDVKGQVVVFMLNGDHGVADALPQAIANTVISSLRPI